jgi:hypothetical protein
MGCKAMAVVAPEFHHTSQQQSGVSSVSPALVFGDETEKKQVVCFESFDMWHGGQIPRLEKF